MRKVSISEARTLAEEIRASYIETSALLALNVEKAFESLAREVL